MADIVSKKKALVKSTQTRSKQKSSFTKTSLQPQAVVHQLLQKLVFLVNAIGVESLFSLMAQICFMPLQS
ncbi:hypothetical protein [Leptolyngbya sp. FACHB-16]|uniref:hypothetical protein n=1 Tax=unclassified Leptolyngbya TaxID=2650499 RepID=UPI001682B99C|nr:hypothetical protein [Leptolyngbya sp. FACHB-16]